MAKITYADKVEIVPKTVHINQWWDVDANEVKTVVNGLDDDITINKNDIVTLNGQVLQNETDIIALQQGKIDSIIAGDGVIIDNSTPTAPKISVNLKRKRFVNVSANGSINLDFSLYDTFFIQAIGDLTFVDVNLPDGENTGCVTIYITGDYNITFPAYWIADVGSAYDGTLQNRVTVDIIDGTTGFEIISYYSETIE